MLKALTYLLTLFCLLLHELVEQTEVRSISSIRSWLPEQGSFFEAGFANWGRQYVTEYLVIYLK